MPEQLSLSDFNRDKGIRKAVDHAERKEPGWKEKAIECVVLYPLNEFMTEDVRAWAYRNGLEKPPHARAWGGVIVTAKNRGLIEFVGYRNVSNPKAHSTPAAVWKKI